MKLESKLTWTPFELAWLFGFTLIGVALSIYLKSNALDFFSCVTGIICVIIIAKGGVWNYPWGFVQGVAYTYVCYTTNVYSEFLLNFNYFLPAQIIGMVIWIQNMNKRTKEVRRRKISNWELTCWMMAAFVITGLYWLFLSVGDKYVAPVGVFIMGFSIVAMALMVTRSKHQWTFWTVVNVLTIYAYCKLWLTEDDKPNYLMASLFVVYLINTVYGWVKWNKRELEDIAEAAAEKTANAVEEDAPASEA